MSKWVPYGIGGVLLGLVLYHSVYFRKLSAMKAATAAPVAAGSFRADAYARTFWQTTLLPQAPRLALTADTLLARLKADPQRVFTAHAHALGIGNIGYFLIRGEGIVTAVNEDDVVLRLPSGTTLSLATECIFGNAARDASGLIRITDFDRQASLNATDLNNVSAQLNDLIRRTVVPALKKGAQPGRPLSFVGALELNRAHLHLNQPTVIPIAVR